jgi:hypothetical protein
MFFLITSDDIQIFLHISRTLRSDFHIEFPLINYFTLTVPLGI